MVAIGNEQEDADFRIPVYVLNDEGTLTKTAQLFPGIVRWIPYATIEGPFLQTTKQIRKTYPTWEKARKQSPS